jgi:hypothetical protein
LFLEELHASSFPVIAAKLQVFPTAVTLNLVSLKAVVDLEKWDGNRAMKVFALNKDSATLVLSFFIPAKLIYINFELVCHVTQLL